MIASYLEDLIRRERPQWRGVQVRDVRPIDRGWETDKYSFDLVYEKSGSSHLVELIARFHAGVGASGKARWETEVLQAAAGAGLPVPRVELVAEESSRFGDAVVLMERVPGTTLSEVLTRSPDLIEAMTEWLVELHDLPVAAIFSGPLRPFENPMFIPPDIGHMEEAVDQYRLHEFQPLIDWLASARPVQPEVCLLHNDYHPGNIIVTSDGGLIILDWSFSGVGDYRLDLAWSALWIGATAGRAAREGLLLAYADKSGKEIEDFEYFEVLKLGSRLLTIAIWLDDHVDPPVPRLTKAAIRGDYRSTVATVYHRVLDLAGIRLPTIEAV